MKLEEAIQQSSFSTEENKAGVNLLYTTSWLTTELMHTLNTIGISWQQFNLMRIVRGQKVTPVSLKTISERMIDRQSNTSRLVDKLVQKGLVNRSQCSKDRRQIDICLTKEGKDLLDEASEAVNALNHRLLGHIGKENLRVLNELLDAIRIEETYH